MAAHTAVHSRYLRLCLSRLPSLLSWSGAVRGPWGGCCPVLLARCHPRGPLDPLLSRGYAPSPTSALSPDRSLFIPGKGASPDVPVTPCLPSSSCSLSHFICEFFLIILFKFAVLPHTSVSLFYLIVLLKRLNHHEHATYYPC